MITSEGHVYGNFQNYYSFHSVDSRIELFTPEIIYNIWINSNQPKLFSILDVGCNEGDLSIALYHLVCSVLSKCKVSVVLLGFDLDDKLILRAQRKLLELSTNITFLTYNIMENSNSSIEQYMSEQNIENFTLTSVFSVTMWIHLNYGDDGLIQFLKRLSGISNNLLMEPQVWKSYKNAVRRARKLGLPKPIFYDHITMRENVDKEIENILTHNDDDDKDKDSFPESEILRIGLDSWRRPLILFQHKRTNSSRIEKESSDIDEEDDIIV